MGLLDGKRTIQELIESAGYVPSGSALPSSVAVAVSAARQPVKRVLQQLVPDFLTPEMQLSVARQLPHPFLASPSVPPQWKMH